MKISCLIIEDEPLAQEKLTSCISKVPYLELKGSFDDVKDAMLFLGENKVDLLFLDINLGNKMSGINLLENFIISPRVIITTAYPEYAVRGYELNVADYLLKPFTYERFLQATDKVRSMLQQAPSAKADEHVFIKSGFKLERINTDEILYIQGMGDYRQFHLSAGKKIMTLQTFNELEKILDPKKICRVHKSYMVSIDKIVSVHKDEIKIAEVIIPISETYRKNFYSIISGL